MAKSFAEILNEPGVAQRRAQLYPLISSAASQYGVPVQLLDALIARESRYVHNIVGDNGQAVGLGQIHPATAQTLGITLAQRTDPRASLDAAARYLASNYKKSGNWVEAAVGYNAGPGNMGKGLSGTDNYRGYAESVLRGSPSAMVNPVLRGSPAPMTNAQAQARGFRSSDEFYNLVHGIVKPHGGTVGSKRGGKHNVGSKHYIGRAVDIPLGEWRGITRAQSDAMLAALQQNPYLKVSDERVRPPGQKVWSNPHIHVEWLDTPRQMQQSPNTSLASLGMGGGAGATPGALPAASPAVQAPAMRSPLDMDVLGVNSNNVKAPALPTSSLSLAELMRYANYESPYSANSGTS